MKNVHPSLKSEVLSLIVLFFQVKTTDIQFNMIKKKTEKQEISILSYGTCAD